MSSVYNSAFNRWFSKSKKKKSVMSELDISISIFVYDKLLRLIKGGKFAVDDEKYCERD
jgi:hypothetical protein